MAIIEEKDNAPVWKLHNVDATYWDEYISTRPIYDHKIFDRVIDYQSSHSASHSAALDIGTGSGSALGPLTKSFDHVVATDNDPTSLEFAKSRHSSIPTEHLSYTLSSGEDLLQHHSPGSFDLITCAETFPLMDTQIALSNIFSLLRPGGTLAVWFYGPPFFTEEEYSTTCQPILDALMDCKFRPVVSGGDEARMKSWKRAADGKFSWLDYIPFDAKLWTDVRRHKWNTQARLSFFTREACDFPVECVRSVGPDEALSEEQDPTFWGVKWNFTKLRSFVNASFPTPNGLVGEQDKMETLFEQLASCMGGQEAERTFSWPAVLLTAAKKVES
ncbi:hypothetical protein PFICI_13482 [Pestalotiopsis fici W106-1]|uniref:Methyltransferase type 11 domain-containing protein n=1 Tax=Pestalotiopsis fici (strain W106-1 / CGMCC3.15140) TaxID=1229662 RepID=W3WM98_PESFW|nr:uncharacterized protein PFICI_13482 [Pestalotiopsis fici W106-1]ETS74998.1 hypothetical protein PFICI_13482 [Pestalotiopsis fici W106-1]